MSLPLHHPINQMASPFSGQMPAVMSPPDMMNCIIEPTDELGGIYLGNLKASNDPEFLRENKIRAVISVVYGQEVSYPEHIIPFHKLINGDDHPSFELSENFEETYNFIEQHRKYTSILIHCFAGISRSATILLAYIMRKEQLSFDESIALVRKSRPAVNPNIGFVDQLRKFEKFLEQVIFKNKKKAFDKENQLSNANIGNQINLINGFPQKRFPVNNMQRNMSMNHFHTRSQHIK